jgi:hypothetical protein
MRRFVPWVLAVLSITFAFGSLTGCGGGSATGTSAVPTPAKITLTPGNSSIDIGTTLLFSASPVTAAGGAITTLPIVYSSSNPSVLSFVPSAGGLACAGKWDTAGRVCTPQGAGVTQVTATGNGVSSPPVIVYVHQHIDQVTVTQFRPPNTPPQPDCVTLAQAPGIQNYLDFQANAFRIVDVNGTPTPIDITNTVGSFTFSQTNAAVAKISTTDPELNNNNGNQITQARVTASAPGLTQVFASVSGVSSLPAQIPDSKGQTHPYFETCLVQSINLQVGNSAGNTSFAVTNNTSGITITPTVTDRLGNKLTNPVPKLDWISLSPQNASLTPNTSTSGSTLEGTATVKASVPGGTGIIATCVAPNCNVGLQPTQAVYSSTNPSGNLYLGTPIIGLITGSPVTSGSVYVTTTQCGTINGCQPLIFPIAIKTNAAGNSATLPSSPNSMLFAPTGKSIFLGSSAGLIIFNPAATGSANPVSQLASAPGKVLAVSLDGDKVIVSDTLSNPNQVYVVSGFSGTGAAVATPLLIPGATAAAFSPDGLKAFITAGSTLYVYSTVQSLKTIPLAAPANAVSFYANGALAYLSGPSGVTMRNACDTAYGQAASFPSGTPALFQVLTDGVHALGLESPGVDVFDVVVTGPTPATTSAPTQTICPFPVMTANSTLVNLGQGAFTPLKLIVSSDNSKAYILASNLGSVFVFDLGVNTVTALPLTGNPVPLDASLTSDGTTLYVGANDGAIHVVSTVSGGDLQQITFTNNNNSNKTSLCSNIPQTCNPDLVAVQP